jgi:hypothetical protein
MESKIAPRKQEHPTKVFTYKNSPASYTVAVTRLDGTGHDPLDRVGIRSPHPLFVVMDQKCRYSSTDAFAIMRGVREEQLKQLLLEIRKGMKTKNQEGLAWYDLEDGATYTKQDVLEMTSE